MRIVSGRFGGRRLESPADDRIRPTSDKVRGAIFNALLSRVDVEGAVVMDLFCGSGALGLEALSRGAARCIFIDSSRESLALTRQNASALGLEAHEAQFIQQDALRLGEAAEAPQVNLVFMDPPYHKGLVSPVLECLHDGGWLVEGCTLVIEAEAACDIDFSVVYVPQDRRTYGTTDVIYVIYRPDCDSSI